MIDERKAVGGTLVQAMGLSAGLHLAVVLAIGFAPGGGRPGDPAPLRVALRPAAVEVPAADESRGSPARDLPAAPRYYKNGEVDVIAKLLSQPPLVLPELSYIWRLPGTVKARVFVDEDGTVEAVHILEAKPLSGLFEQAALTALQRLRYSPALLSGRPVKTVKVIEVTFDPSDAQAPADVSLAGEAGR